MTLCSELCKNGWTNWDAVSVVGSRNHVLDRGFRSHHAEQFLGERTCLGVPHDTLQWTWTVQESLNRSRYRYRLGCGLEWAEGSMYYIGGTWRHLTNTTEPSMCSGDAALCQITLTTWQISHKLWSPQHCPQDCRSRYSHTLGTHLNVAWIQQPTKLFQCSQ